MRFELDLSEGIDLSIFVLGDFRPWVTDTKYFSLPADGVAFDVGANIGSVALKLAQKLPSGLIYAFEPTEYAYSKLLRNIQLNPSFSPRIVPIHAYLSDISSERCDLTAYASWKVDGKAAEYHAIHKGTVKSSGSVPSWSIDDFVREKSIQRLDLIKIDTDGHELKVLLGARKSLKEFSPTVIFEIGLFIIEEMGIEYEQYHRYLTDLGYDLINSKGGHTVDMNNYWKEIPLLATTDIIAIPRGKRSVS